MKCPILSNKLLVTSLIAIAFSSTLARAEGGNVGNGGMAYVCYGPTRADGTREIRSAQLADYWEARAGAYDIDIDLGADIAGQDDVDSMVGRALENLKRIDPARAADYQKRIPLFFADQKLMKGALIEKTLDANLILRPKDPKCEITQLVYQVKTPKPMQKKFLIDEEIYNVLPDTDRAGILLHEVAYWAEIEKGATTSDGTRDIVRLISSKQILTLNRDVALTYLRDYTLVNSPVMLGGQEVWLKTIQSNGTIYTAKPTELRLTPSAILYAGSARDVTCTNGMEFNAQTQKTVCSSGAIDLGNGVTFYSNYSIAIGTLVNELKGYFYSKNGSVTLPLAAAPKTSIEIFKYEKDWTHAILNEKAEILSLDTQSIGTFVLKNEFMTATSMPGEKRIGKFETQFGTFEAPTNGSLRFDLEGNVSINYYDGMREKYWAAADVDQRMSHEDPVEFIQFLAKDSRLKELSELIAKKQFHFGGIRFRNDGTISALRIGSSKKAFGNGTKVTVSGTQIKIHDVDYKSRVTGTIIEFDRKGNVARVTSEYVFRY